ncbi:MAG: pyridoxamine 5'-phosphate oxidase family protein [Spirochaetaceae bacterium]|jgi:nitroimidazol reductase NimA-like FMN-containing flavoprotein (pyridoxamine 5'-phosphate oxidase superfamily)|nr:pyridoxamine 5'-phosphate oxidase family protein [Spirochaetaceae bacterium]
MRRKEREITDLEELLAVVSRCKVCRLAMAENNRPYVVPLNFGYEYQNGELSLYFHGAQEGKKIDILKNNPEVCFEMDGGHQLIEGREAHEYSFAYESVIGFGRIVFVEEDEKKAYGLNLLMKHQTGQDRDFVFDGPRLRATAVYRVTARSFTGKRRDQKVPLRETSPF